MDLEVWKRSIDLVENIYQIIKKFPREENYTLASQFKKSAISIPSNIAEGASRNSKKEFTHFLFIALGSASELETQIIIAARLRFIKSTESILNDIEVIKKMLNGLITHLKRNIKK